MADPTDPSAPDSSHPMQDWMSLWTRYLPGAQPVAEAADVPGSPWMQANQNFMAMQQQALQQWSSLWATVMPGLKTADAAPDKRFADEAWARDPRFAGLSQLYLKQTEWINQALSAAPVDDRTKRQWQFVMRQLVDAASPANCLLTNPDAMQAAVDSGGASLVDGMKLFADDLAKGRISMSDDTAFEVGRNVATTPGSVVFENDLFQLIQYAPTTAKVHARPLLIVPPCINKYYILDLQPDNSLVAHAASQGHTVFLVSWRNIGADLAHLGWDDYVEQGLLKAIDVSSQIGKSDQINALGFCIGGTLLTCALAVAAARGDRPVASVTLLTTLLDFSDSGELGLMVDEQMLANKEASIGQGGLLKGRELAQIFAALRANDLIWPYVVNSYLKGKAPPAFDLLYWNGDDSNLPGPMACWYLRHCYLENQLRQPGGTRQCGSAVDLAQVDVPAFVYASREDHIVPWTGAYTSSALLGGPVQFVLGASGHIAGVINPPAKRKRHHWTGPLQPDAQTWLAGAQRHDGSWWPVWTDWLVRHAGAQKAAPRTPGNSRYPVIEPAPGRYVKAKAE